MSLGDMITAYLPMFLAMFADERGARDCVDYCLARDSASRWWEVEE